MSALMKSRFLLGLVFFFTLTIQSCGPGNNMQIPGVEGPYLYLEQDNLLISMVLENVQIEGGGRFAIPKYPNSYFEISPDLQSGGTLLAFYVSLDDIFGNVGILDPQKLPGGRNLHGVATGALPAVAFSVESLKGIVFYLGPNVFGVFVPLEMGMQGTMITSRFYTGSKYAGTLTLVGEDTNSANSGLLLLLNVNSSVQSYLKGVAAKY